MSPIWAAVIAGPLLLETSTHFWKNGPFNESFGEVDPSREASQSPFTENRAINAKQRTNCENKRLSRWDFFFNAYSPYHFHLTTICRRVLCNRVPGNKQVPPRNGTVPYIFANGSRETVPSFLKYRVLNRSNVGRAPKWKIQTARSSPGVIMNFQATSLRLRSLKYELYRRSFYRRGWSTAWGM